MFSSNSILLFACCALSLLAFNGCSGSSSIATDAHAEHAHGADHDHPETLADAVKELIELRDTVRDSLAKKNLKLADESLHEIGHLLEKVPGLALKASLTKEQSETLKKSTGELFDLFGKIDEKMHGGKGMSYEEAAAKIDAAIEALRPFVKSATPAAAS